MAATAVGGGLVTILLALVGQLHPWVSPDTSGYLDAIRAAAPLAQPRLPLYGWFLAPLIGPPDLTALIPWLQGGGFLLASLWLVAALRRLGVSEAAALAVGLALAGSNQFILWSNALQPEVPAHAALLAAMALSIDIAAGARACARVVLAVLFLTLAWAQLPVLLPFVVLLPLLVVLLPADGAGRARKARLAAALLVGGLLPLLALAECRQALVDDFNVVSFGGFQMAGMTAQILSPDIAARLPEPQRADALQIIAARTSLIAQGRAFDIPLNSTGRRSFPSVAVFYFDILVRSHDTVLYDGVASLRHAGESWPEFNRRLQRLDFAVLRAAPVEYGAWVVGAASRLAGHALVLNPAFMLATACCLGLLLLRGRRRSGSAPPLGRDIHVLAAVTCVYSLGSSLLIVLITIPANRYIDSAAMLLAAWPLYGLLRLSGPRPAAGKDGQSGSAFSRPPKYRSARSAAPAAG